MLLIMKVWYTWQYRMDSKIAGRNTWSLHNLRGSKYLKPRADQHIVCRDTWVPEVWCGIISTVKESLIWAFSWSTSLQEQFKREASKSERFYHHRWYAVRDMWWNKGWSWCDVFLIRVYKQEKVGTNIPGSSGQSKRYNLCVCYEDTRSI